MYAHCLKVYLSFSFSTIHKDLRCLNSSHSSPSFQASAGRLAQNQAMKKDFYDRAILFPSFVKSTDLCRVIANVFLGTLIYFAITPTHIHLHHFFHHFQQHLEEDQEGCPPPPHHFLLLHPALCLPT